MRKKVALFAITTSLLLGGFVTSCDLFSNKTEPEIPGPVDPNKPDPDKPVDPDDGGETPDSKPDPKPEPEPEPEEEPNLVTGKEALNMLKNSPFKDNVKTNENLGLAETHKVGVDKKRFEEEIKDTVPSDAKIYIAEDYDIKQEADSNTGALTNLLKSLKTEKGNKVVKFKSGIYKFGGTFDVTGIEDLYLVGEEGTTFMNYGWGTYFEAKISKNLHIMNITFDMYNSPTIAGYIKSYTTDSLGGVVTLTIPEEFDLNAEIYKNWKEFTPSSYMECTYDEKTGGYVPNNPGNLYYNSPTSRNNPGIRDVAYNSTNKELTIKLNNKFAKFKNPKIGGKVSFAYTMYENHGLHFVECENVYLENIKMHVSGGMGLRFEGGKNVYANHCHFGTKKGSERIMTSTADIFHTMALEGDLNISNCLFEGSHDDALNIKSFYTAVSAVSGASREITVKQTQSEVTIKFDVGDTIEVYDKSTMTLVDTYKIVSLVKQGLNYKLKVDKRPRNIENGMIVGNATKATKMTLENSIIRNKRNRGILLQARNSKIINCTFQNVVMGAIQVLGVADKFAEAIVPQNIEISNNKFLTNKGGDISVFAYGSKGANFTVPGTIKNVQISNNYHYNGNNFGVNLLGVSNVNVENNLYDIEDRILNEIVRIKATDIANIKNNLLLSRHNINFIKEDVKVTNLVNENNIKKETI